LNAELEFKHSYPAIFKHLTKFKKGLENRNKAETGIRYEWYALQRWGANYWEDFFRPKIIWKRIGSIIRFSYDESELYGLDSTCIAVCGNDTKYLTAILNSSMGRYMLQDSPQTGTGDLLISVQAVLPLKVPIIESNLRTEIEKLVDKITPSEADSLQTTFANQAIDRKIYDLYNLTQQEINYVESIVN
jgi:hypothetical protein